MQLAKENQLELNFPRIRLPKQELTTEDAVSASLKKALACHAALQAQDGHWPGDFSGPMFIMPVMVIN